MQFRREDHMEERPITDAAPRRCTCDRPDWRFLRDRIYRDTGDVEVDYRCDSCDAEWTDTVTHSELMRQHADELAYEHAALMATDGDVPDTVEWSR